PDMTTSPWREGAAQPAETFLNTYAAPTLTRLLDSYARSAMGAPLGEVSTYCLRNFYSGEFGQAFQCPRYSIRGGLATLCHRLADHIGGDRLWRQCLAFRSEHVRRDLVRTLCITADRECIAIDSAAVVFAGPKFLAKHLVPELPSAQRQAIENLQYAPYLTVHLLTPFRLLPRDTFDLWVLEAQLFTDIADATPLQLRSSEAFVSCIYAPLPTTQRTLLLQDVKLQSMVYAIVEEALHLLAPERATEPPEVSCFVWGHALVIPTPTALLGAAQSASRPVGRVVFANTDNDASPALENALEHALRSAETVHRLLRPHSPRPLIRRPT
ncbi:MAG: FAD-dependent oxidoreductase, partial [Bacteroidota bacterium]|nr:FAD-dependent oxidoreductase [Bacteroidota bacterium]